MDNNGRDAIRIRFATVTCAPCPVRDQCTRSTQYGRQLTVRPQNQDAVLERVRAEQSRTSGSNATQPEQGRKAPSTRPSRLPESAAPATWAWPRLTSRTCSQLLLST
nr:transposase [Streptomyces sp. TRM68367]